MRFNLIYAYLKKQVFTPTVKAKCRVYMAKDLRCYQKQYADLMRQLAGSHWNPLVQKIDYDNMLIKKYMKAATVAIVVCMFIFILI